MILKLAYYSYASPSAPVPLLVDGEVDEEELSRKVADDLLRALVCHAALA